MGQKTHPYAFRKGIVNDWKSRWFNSKDYKELVNQDYQIRNFLIKELPKAAVSRVDIERRDKGGTLTVDIHTARPGVVIGRKGVEADRLRKGIEKLSKQPVKLNIIEIREAELDAQLLARGIADQRNVRFGLWAHFSMRSRAQKCPWWTCVPMGSAPMGHPRVMGPRTHLPTEPCTQGRM